MSVPSAEPDKFDIAVSADLLDTLVMPPTTIAVDGLTNFHWSIDALRIHTVDAANAIVVNQTVYPPAFETYEISPENNDITFGTRCRTISNLLKAARPTDIVSLRLDRETNRMNIQFSDVNYSLSGVDPEAIDEPTIPELDFDVEATVHSEVLQRACQVIGMMSETIKFKIASNQFQVSGRGDSDIAEINVDLEDSEEAILDRDRKCAATTNTITQPAEARYGTQFIDYINQFTPTGCFTMELSEDHPLRITAEQADGHLETEIIIAPRMDST